MVRDENFILNNIRMIWGGFVRGWGELRLVGISKQHFCVSKWIPRGESDKTKIFDYSNFKATMY